MMNTNATNFRSNIFDYLNQAIVYNDVINVNTKNGNAIVISEEDYRGMQETIYLLSNSKTAAEILSAMKEDKNQGKVYDPAEEW